MRIVLGVPNKSTVGKWTRKHTNKIMQLLILGKLIVDPDLYYEISKEGKKLQGRGAFGRIGMNTNAGKGLLITMSRIILGRSDLVLQWAQLWKRQRQINPAAHKAHAQALDAITHTVDNSFPVLHEKLYQKTVRFLYGVQRQGRFDPKALAKIHVNVALAELLGSRFSDNDVNELSDLIEESMENPLTLLAFMGGIGTAITYVISGANRRRSDRLIKIIGDNIEGDLKDEMTLAGRLYKVFTQVYVNDEARSMVIMYFTALIQAAAHTAIIPMTYAITEIARNGDISFIEESANQIKAASPAGKSMKVLANLIPNAVAIGCDMVHRNGSVVTDPVKIQVDFTASNYKLKKKNTIWLALNHIANARIIQKLGLDPSMLGLRDRVQTYLNCFGDANAIYEDTVTSIVFKTGYPGSCGGARFAVEEVIISVAAFVRALNEFDSSLQVVHEPEPGNDMIMTAKNGEIAIL